jgi:hypothetical protein
METTGEAAVPMDLGEQAGQEITEPEREPEQAAQSAAQSAAAAAAAAAAEVAEAQSAAVAATAAAAAAVANYEALAAAAAEAEAAAATGVAAAAATGAAAAAARHYELLVSRLPELAAGEVKVHMVDVGYTRKLPVVELAGANKVAFLSHVQALLEAERDKECLAMADLIRKEKPSDTRWCHRIHRRPDVKNRALVTVYSKTGSGKTAAAASSAAGKKKETTQSFAGPLPPDLVKAGAWVRMSHLSKFSETEMDYQKHVVVLRLVQKQAARASEAADEAPACLKGDAWAPEAEPGGSLTTTLQFLEEDFFKGGPRYDSFEGRGGEESGGGKGKGKGKGKALAEIRAEVGRAVCVKDEDFVEREGRLLLSTDNPFDGNNPEVIAEFSHTVEDGAQALAAVTLQLEDHLGKGLDQRTGGLCRLAETKYHTVTLQMGALVKAYNNPEKLSEHAFNNWLQHNCHAMGSGLNANRAPAKQFKQFAVYVYKALLDFSSAEARKRYGDGTAAAEAVLKSGSICSKLNVVSLALSPATSKWLAAYLSASSKKDENFNKTVKDKANYLKAFYNTSVAWWVMRIETDGTQDKREPLEKRRLEIVARLERMGTAYSGKLGRPAAETRRILEAGSQPDASRDDKSLAAKVQRQEERNLQLGAAPSELNLVPSGELLQQEAEKRHRNVICESFIKHCDSFLAYAPSNKDEMWKRAQKFIITQMMYRGDGWRKGLYSSFSTLNLKTIGAWIDGDPQKVTAYSAKARQLQRAMDKCGEFVEVQTDQYKRFTGILMGADHATMAPKDHASRLHTIPIPLELMIMFQDYAAVICYIYAENAAVKQRAREYVLAREANDHDTLEGPHVDWLQELDSLIPACRIIFRELNESEATYLGHDNKDEKEQAKQTRLDQHLSKLVREIWREAAEAQTDPGEMQRVLEMAEKVTFSWWRKEIATKAQAYMSPQLRRLYAEQGMGHLLETSNKHYAFATETLECFLLWLWRAQGRPEDEKGRKLLQKAQEQLDQISKKERTVQELTESQAKGRRALEAKEKRTAARGWARQAAEEEEDEDEDEEAAQETGAAVASSSGAREEEQEGQEAEDPPVTPLKGKKRPAPRFQDGPEPKKPRKKATECWLWLTKDPNAHWYNPTLAHVVRSEKKCSFFMSPEAGQGKRRMSKKLELSKLELPHKEMRKVWDKDDWLEVLKGKLGEVGYYVHTEYHKTDKKSMEYMALLKHKLKTEGLELDA